MRDTNEKAVCRNSSHIQGIRMGEQREIKRRIHSIEYIEQMMAWGFDKDFIAKDMQVSRSSLETRLRRKRVREQENEH